MELQMKRVGAVLSGLALAGALVAGSPAWSAQPPALPEGLTAPAKPTAMPAFELPTTAGATLRSTSLKGQVLVIRFWASW